MCSKHVLRDVLKFRSVVYNRAHGAAFDVGGGWGGGGGVVGLWTLKMIYLVPTQYFLIQSQLINHFFLKLERNNISNKQSVTMHSSIIIFACFIYFESLSVLSLQLLYQSLSLVIVEQSHVLKPSSCRKGPFPAVTVTGFTSRSFQIMIISFIMLC